MKRRQVQRTKTAKERTTVTLPSESLAHAKRIAQARNVTLSTIVSDAFVEGLRKYTAAERAEQILEAYRRPFKGLSDEEMLVLDGIIMEPITKRKR